VKLKFIPRLAKFANYNTFSDTGFGTDSIAPNTSFSKDGNMIRGSKMNEDIKEDKGESPF
jgi:hypothetical protein